MRLNTLRSHAKRYAAQALNAVTDRPYQRIGENINGANVKNPAKALAHIAAARPALTLVMDNLSFAVQAKQAAGSGGIVIHRNWHPANGLEWRSKTPQQVVAQWANEGHPEIYRYPCNEPSFEAHTLSEYLAWEIEIMRLSYDAGIHVCTLNLGVGRYEPLWIMRGDFDDYLRELSRYDGWHLLGLHEYTAIAMPYGFGTWSDEYLLNRDNVQPENWPDIDPIVKLTDNGNLPNFWHYRRSDWFTLRSRQLGLSDPLIALTEWGVDYMGDVAERPPHVFDKLKEYFGSEGYAGLRGFNSLKGVYHYYWPQWTFEEAVFNQMVHADKSYPPNVIGYTVFTRSESPDWQDFNTETWDEWHRLVEAYRPPVKSDKPGCLPRLINWLQQLDTNNR